MFDRNAGTLSSRSRVSDFRHPTSHRITAACAMLQVIWSVAHGASSSRRHAPFRRFRGSTPLVRFGARFIRASLARQIPISQFVADPIGEPSTVLLNGVPVPHRTIATDIGFLMAQRLEPEKQTDVDIEARARTSLRHQWWWMVVAAEVPVIAARGGAHTEMVGIVSDRWLSSDGDAAEAASMLGALGHDAEAREHNGGQFRAVQRQRLSVDIHVDCLEAIYRDVAR